MIDRGTKPDMSTNRRPTLAVVVPTYNAPEALEANLESLARQADRPDEVLVADDGSKEPTRAVVDAFRSRLPLDHVWHPDDGFRLSEIRNKAIAKSRCDYIVLLDGDTVAHRRFVEDHRAFAHAGRAVAAGRCGVSGFHGKPMPVPTPLQLVAWHLSGRIFNDTDRNPQSFATRSKGVLKGIRTPWASYRKFAESGGNRVAGGNLAFWRSDAVAINGFDESFIGWGQEDEDFCHRLRRSGREMWQLLGRAVCFHINHPTKPATPRNRDLMKEERPVRCAAGIDRHPGAAA